MKSIAAQLRSGLWLGLAAAVALLLWLGSLAVERALGNYVESRLGHAAEALLGAIDFAAPDLETALANPLAPVYRQPLSGHYYVLLLEDGRRIRSRSLWDQDLALQPLPPGSVDLQHLPGPQGQSLLVRSAGYHKRGHRLSLLLAEDVAEVEQTVRLYRWLVIGGALLLGGLLMWLQQRAIRAGLRPLEQARADIERMASGQIEQLDEQAPAELLPLIRQINRLIERYDQHLARSRNALGNLTHAMKTPLARLGQLARAPAIADDRELQSQIEQQLLQLQRLIERELTRARLSGSAVSGQRFNPAEDIPPLLQTLAQIHRQRGLQIDAGELPDQPLPYDPEDLSELLGNLLDNACKWARARVQLDCALSDEQLLICIDDDGPGIDPALRDELLRRGSRTDESVAGHGIGLAIVRDIVQLYAGQLDLQPAPQLGGLRVRLTLPLH